jgi:hypothetical protein
MGKEENIIGLQHSWQLTNVTNVLESFACATHVLSKPYHSPVDPVEVGTIDDIDAAHKRLSMCRSI